MGFEAIIKKKVTALVFELLAVKAKIKLILSGSFCCYGKLFAPRK